MAIKKTRKRTALAASALGLLGLAPQTASADAVNNDQMDATKEASNAASDNAFAQVASDAHSEFSSAASLLNSSSAVSSSQASSNVVDDQSSAASKEVDAPAESQKTDSDTTISVGTSSVKTETAGSQAVSQSVNTSNAKANVSWAVPCSPCHGLFLGICLLL